MNIPSQKHFYCMLRCLASMSPKAHFRILGGYWTGHALWVTGPRPIAQKKMGGNRNDEY